jgi:FAD/FMN-containing dehydrogenase
MTDKWDGGVFRRGEAGYEEARRGHMWNARVPARHPDVVVQAGSERDVVAAVGMAKREGLRIAMRSGGHSWSANFLRDGGMLLDLGRLQEWSINIPAKTAWVRPGVIGTDLNRALKAHGLFFPTGHCTSVGLGGFLLQGGFGWNSRLWGPACASVTAIDVVTADGELVHADASQNSDLYWAARGAGPGFFGAVTRFHLALKPRPKIMMNSTYLYPISVMDEVYTWAAEIRPRLPRSMEPLVFMRRDLFGHPGPGLLVTGPTMADSRDEALAALALLETCPVLDRALKREVNIETELDELLAGGEEAFYWKNRRYAADNIWTNAEANELLPAMRHIAETLPGVPSHMMWILWGPEQAMPDMAFSMQGDIYVAVYSVWDKPADDEKHQAWVTDNMRALEPLGKGIQLADENLATRPFRFMSEMNLRRLEELRAKRDPDGLFHSYMAVPIQA